MNETLIIALTAGLVGAAAVFYALFSLLTGRRYEVTNAKKTSAPQSDKFGTIDKLVSGTKAAKSPLTLDEQERLAEARTGLTQTEFQVKRTSRATIAAGAGTIFGYALGSEMLSVPPFVSLGLAAALGLIGWRFAWKDYASRGLKALANRRREEIVKHFYELSDTSSMFLGSFPPRDAIVKSLPYLSNPELVRATSELVTSLNSSGSSFEQSILDFQALCIPDNPKSTYSGEHVKSWCSRMIQAAKTGHDVRRDMDAISRGVRGKRNEAREKKAETASGIAVVSIMLGFIVGVVPLVAWCTIMYDNSGAIGGL